MPPSVGIRELDVFSEEGMLRLHGLASICLHSPEVEGARNLSVTVQVKKIRALTMHWQSLGNSRQPCSSYHTGGCYVLGRVDVGAKSYKEGRDG